jgi:hypothetical protein
VIPPRKSAAFVWRMEEILDLYEEPYDPLRPVVCFDERPCQLIGDVRDPLPMKPGSIECFDSEYERGGVCWVLMSFEPLGGWRELVVTERRRKREFALAMRRLAEEQYPNAEKIRVVMDNLSTHSGAAFYENFSAEDARKLARRIEFCYTPVHGSWLNMVEIEISVLVRHSASSGGDCRTWRGWTERLQLGAKSAIGSERAWIGDSGRRMHASSCAVSTHQ